jgi:putative transposase
MKDHVHICLSISPKFYVSNVVGYLKGKSAISIAKNFRGRQRNFNGESVWARGYFIPTVGLDESMVIEYIRNQEKDDGHRHQLKFQVKYALAFTLAL